MSKTHPVVFSFGGAEHHLTMAEAQSAIGRLNAAIAGAAFAQERESRATRERLEALSRESAPQNNWIEALPRLSPSSAWVRCVYSSPRRMVVAHMRVCRLERACHG
jgi:hypothetical protein